LIAIRLLRGHFDFQSAAGAATELVMRYPNRARGLVLVDAALGLTAPPSDPPALLR